MNKYQHLEMMDKPHTPNKLFIYAMQVERITALTLHTQNLTSLLHDCLEFVPSDLRRKIENALGE